jgi:hypothetical protein
MLFGKTCDTCYNLYVDHGDTTNVACHKYSDNHGHQYWPLPKERTCEDWKK